MKTIKFTIAFLALTFLQKESTAQYEDVKQYISTLNNTEDKTVGNKATYSVPKDLKIVFVVDSTTFYDQEEFVALGLKNFTIDGKYYDPKNKTVNLIIFIKTEEE